MKAAWLGMDVGGSKTQIRLCDADNTVLLDRQWPTGHWSGETYAHKAARMAALIDEARGSVAGGVRLRAVGIGAHGCDTPEECARMTMLMARRLQDSPVAVVNDAALVALSAGRPHAAGLIAGTGAVAVAQQDDKRWLLAGGWGWVVGDEGGASGLVREAIKAVLTDWDRGRERDPLTQALVQAFGVEHQLDLPSQLLRLPMSDWSRHAKVIFDCAAEGSALAQQVVEDGALALAALIMRLRARGANVREVVAAGSVIRHQPSLFAGLAAALRRIDPTLTLTLLTEAPVTGAVTLARQIEPCAAFLSQGE